MSNITVYCKLDKFKCLSLEQVVKSYCAPIKEEHAWAIVHQGVLSILGVVGQPCFLVSGMVDVLISQEGLIHPNTFTRSSQSRLSMTNMATGVAELGVAVYDALDWSVTTDSSMERTLSPELESLLDVMTSGDDLDYLDEGIGEEEVATRLCEKVLELCRHHLALPGEAGQHYQQVCRAVVAEALELSSLMSKLSTRDLEELEQLDRQEWAGIFNDVMSELRHGIKLKAVDYSRTPTEFSMTPYEMLMYDIKSKKAVLKPPVPVHVERAARDHILDFIRSRPPLKPVSARKLNSPKQEETPVENLMNEIRGGQARKSLRRTRVRRKAGNEETFGKIVEKVVETNKKVIDLDEVFRTTITNFEEESPDNSLEFIPSSPESCHEDDEFCSNLDGNVSPGVSSAEASPTEENPPRDLTLEEVGHIRSQITSAELAGLDISKDKRKDYDKGRICFLCAKTRFNLFNWAYPCQLCKRQVCKTCSDKIRLPSHRLGDIPVSSLKSQLRAGGEKGGSSPASKPGLSRGWQRTSLRCQSSSEVGDLPKFTRSKTLTKAEVDKMKEKAFDAATEAVGVNHSVCRDCKDLLASMVWGKKGTKSPRKKSIFDLQSVTISKRRCSTNK